jgi:hypothetical protein
MSNAIPPDVQRFIDAWQQGDEGLRWMKRSTKYESALAKAVHYEVPGGTQRHARQDIWTTHAWIAKRAPLAADRWMDG